ncbi:hypothetical protein ACQ858_13235 [Variovorax ureilyticus]|uniref:hypothetical protein n=1 Tax=Variovorax ureilyticus TaxID=1836198 RepID=UPI003D675542
MNTFIRTVLVLSAFSPVLFSLAYVRYDMHGGWSTEIVQLLVIGLLGSLLPYLILKELGRRSELVPFRAKKVESSDFMLLIFLFSYVSPLVGRAAGMDFAHIVVAMAAFAIICWFVQSIPAHPILRLFSIRFYKIESENGMVYTLISREELRSPAQVKSVHLISTTMLLKAD